MEKARSRRTIFGTPAERMPSLGRSFNAAADASIPNIHKGNLREYLCYTCTAKGVSEKN